MSKARRKGNTTVQDGTVWTRVINRKCWGLGTSERSVPFPSMDMAEYNKLEKLLYYLE